jgi:hypothetical protein
MTSVPAIHDAELEKGFSSQEKVNEHANGISQEHLNRDSGHDEPIESQAGEAPITEAEIRQIKDRNPNVVDWDGEDDPGWVSVIQFITPHRVAHGYSRNPVNWPERRKWASMGIVGLMCFVSPFASTLPAPALPRIAEQFGITNSSVAAMCVSVCTS